MKFHGEIQYTGTDENGNEIGYIHSDICYRCGADDDKPISQEHREFLHTCLDEWLDKSNGTGAFWVGDSEYFSEWGADVETEQVRMERDAARRLALELLPFVRDYIRFGTEAIGAPTDDHEPDSCPDCQFYSGAMQWKERFESGTISNVLGTKIDFE